VVKSARRTKNQQRTRRSFRWWVAMISGVVAAFMVMAGVIYVMWAKRFDMGEICEMSERSAVFDFDGKIYSRLQGENRITVKLSEVSPYFLRALVAREDSRFYGHPGVDLMGIARAVVKNITHGSAKEGASTLTQQLARNSYPAGLGTKKSLHRKLLEAVLAVRIERNYTKDEILEAYVNRIYFGSTVYGVETASQTYFSKSALELTLGEAAILAGLIRAPSRFSPLKNLQGALRERDAVLARMVKLEMITEGEADAAIDQQVVLAKGRPFAAQENYAMDLVQRELEDLLTDAQRANGGMKIYTSIDPVLQKAAENALELELKKIESKAGYKHPKKADFSAEAKFIKEAPPYLQGAVVVIDNATGGIRALVGGRDFSESQYNRAIASPGTRQICSTFKPFVYAAAYGQGLLPGTLINDGPITIGEIHGAGNWAPGNSDRTDKGKLRAEEGLILSRNTMSVRVGDRAGIEEVKRVASAVGLHSMPRLPAAYLGALEANVREVTEAYTVFANGGLRRQSYLIERIDDAEGETIYRSAHLEARALEPGVSWFITNGLRKVFERGTAASAERLGFSKPAAGKTGTNDDYQDAWFVGYTTSLTCGVWVGLDSPQTIVSHGYGAALALPVWVDVINQAPSRRYPAREFTPPGVMRKVAICAVSSQLATAACERAETNYLAELPDSRVPKVPCLFHQKTSPSDLPVTTSPKKTGEPSLLRSFKRFFGGE
jgi:penicillin-binding protein 1A